MVKRIIKAQFSMIFAVCLLVGAGFSASAEKYPSEFGFSKNEIILGGEMVGMAVKTDGIVVTGFGEVKNGLEVNYPAKDAGILEGDTVFSADGVNIDGISEFTKIISRSGGKEIKLGIKRGDKTLFASLKPARDSSGNFKAGIWVRDKIAGIGTVTFTDSENGSFASLGHGICTSGSNTPVPIKDGSTYGVIFKGINKSSIGKPGEIKGSLTLNKTGNVIINAETGVYGTFDSYKKEKVACTPKNEVKKGKAQIVCTVSASGKKAYDAEIEEICDLYSDTKNFIVKITDSELLDITGGIVQGMSGSPIIQDGKLVGAVTHVLVNDPTKGYGIFIENMLDTAEKNELKKAS